MAEQLKAIGHRFVDYIFGVTAIRTSTSTTIAELIAPQGKFGLIDDPKPLDVAKLKGKSVSLHWEAMFTRSTFQTPTWRRSTDCSNEVADAGRHRHDPHDVAENLGTINAANLRRAHAHDRERAARAARSCWKDFDAYVLEHVRLARPVPPRIKCGAGFFAGHALT